MHTQHGRDDDIQSRPQSGPKKGPAKKAEQVTPKKPHAQPKVPMTNMSRKDYLKVRARQKKKLFDELRALGNLQGWKSFAGSCFGTLAGLIIFCLVCSFLSLFTSRGKTQVADTKVKTVSSPKKTAAPQPKVEATSEEQTTEPEPTQPNVSEELPPAAAATPEEPDVTAPVERVILKIVADEDIRFLGLKGDKGPPGVSVSLFYDKQVIAQTKVGKKGTFNFYFDAPQLVPKEGKLEVRCTLPEDQKVSAVLNVSIFKNEDGVQQEKKPTYDSKTDLFHVKLK